MQQATGQEDFGPIVGEWQGEEQEATRDQTTDSRRQQHQRDQSEPGEGPPSVHLGPPEITIEVEGEDY